MPNRAVSADLLIDRLWGGQPGSAAAKNLQVLVSQLRKVLADDGEGPIATVSSGYLLRVAPGATDVERFEELLAHARDQLDGGRPRDAERTLDEALALWRGGAYQDVAYEDFARDEIARLERSPAPRHRAAVRGDACGRPSRRCGGVARAGRSWTTRCGSG